MEEVQKINHFELFTYIAILRSIKRRLFTATSYSCDIKYKPHNVIV